MTIRPRPLSGLLLGLSALCTGACTSMCGNTYGVDIHNRTGQNLVVEFLDVASDGSTMPYSTARLAPKGTFSNKVPHDEQGFGKRVRFSIPDRPPEDAAAHVELKLSDEQSRYYDLVLTNGRLMAHEFKKGFEPTRPADLTGQ